MVAEDGHYLASGRASIDSWTAFKRVVHLATFLNCVAYAEDELVVMRDGQPIAAVISMDGWRVLRRVAEDVIEQLGEERLRMLVGAPTLDN